MLTKYRKYISKKYTINAQMEYESEPEQYEYLKQNLEYRKDLNDIFKTLSGYYYDRKTKKIVKAKDFTKIMSDYAINLYMDRTIKAMTNITRLSDNKKEVITFKSISAKADLWKLTHTLIVTDKTVRKLARERLGVLDNVINGLTFVMDDSYRQSHNMKTAHLLYKRYQVSENIQHTKGRTKKGFLDGFKEEEEEI